MRVAEHDVAFLQLADALPHEDERHVVQQHARHAEEGPQRNAHAEAIEQREDHGQRREADDDAERDREGDVRPFVEQRLVEQRRLGALAIHGEERDERERRPPPCSSALFTFSRMNCCHFAASTFEMSQ